MAKSTIHPQWLLASTRGLAALHSQLLRLSKEPDLIGTVALMLSFPVYEAHTFLFRVAYAMGERRLAALRCGKAA